MTVQLRSGQVFTHEVSDYPGASNQPFTWKEAVRSLEDIQVKDLMKAPVNLTAEGHKRMRNHNAGTSD